VHLSASLSLSVCHVSQSLLFSLSLYFFLYLSFSNSVALSFSPSHSFYYSLFLSHPLTLSIIHSLFLPVCIYLSVFISVYLCLYLSISVYLFFSLSFLTKLILKKKQWRFQAIKVSALQQNLLNINYSHSDKLNTIGFKMNYR
jgi:hypothetical protein